MKTVFVDYVKHLQEILDEIQQGLFEVSSIRNMNTDKEKVSVVVTALAGSVYENSATIPYVVEVITNKPNEIINIFTALAKEHNNKSFLEVVEDEEATHEYTVFETYSTPAIAEKDANYETNHIVRLVMYVSLAILFEVGNVSKIEIDGEEIEFRSGAVSYATESFSLRESGKNLNRALKKAATTTLQITMVNKTNVFVNKLFQIMFGELSGNTIFTCKITLTNGIVKSLPMIIDNNAFNFARNSANLPSLNITLVNTKQRN